MNKGQVYGFVGIVLAAGVAYFTRQAYGPPGPPEPIEEDASAKFETTRPTPSAAPLTTWSTHALSPFEASMPEPVRKDVTSIAATIDDATIVIIQLKRAEGPPMSLEERVIELAKAISVELVGAEQSTPQKRKLGTWEGIEIITKGTLDGKRRVHTAWLCESGPSDAFAVVTTREADKPVSEAGVARFMASIRQTKAQAPAK